MKSLCVSEFIAAKLSFSLLGHVVRLGMYITFYNPSMISLDTKVYIAYNNWFCAGGLIEINWRFSGKTS